MEIAGERAPEQRTEGQERRWTNPEDEQLWGGTFEDRKAISLPRHKFLRITGFYPTEILR